MPLEFVNDLLLASEALVTLQQLLRNEGSKQDAILTVHYYRKKDDTWTWSLSVHNFTMIPEKAWAAHNGVLLIADIPPEWRIDERLVQAAKRIWQVQPEPDSNGRLRWTTRITPRVKITIRTHLCPTGSLRREVRIKGSHRVVCSL